MPEKPRLGCEVIWEHVEPHHARLKQDRPMVGDVGGSSHVLSKRGRGGGGAPQTRGGQLSGGGEPVREARSWFGPT